MIKDIKRFLRESDAEHKKFLSHVTDKKNIGILEKMLSSHIFSYMHFSDDDKPFALYKLALRRK